MMSSFSHVLLRVWPLRVLIVVLLCGAALSAWWASQLARQRALDITVEQGASQLRVYASSLRILIDRYRALPAVLALDPELRHYLQQSSSPRLQARINTKLEQINAQAGSSILMLLDRQGITQASSNWRSPLSLVGQNYHFRPYFQQARSQGTGRFYAVGVTTSVPGYFLARAIRSAQGAFLGAVVVKLEFPELEQSWSQRPDTVLVSDGRGIVFIANHTRWRYRILEPLATGDQRALEASRQYDRQPLTPLLYQTLDQLESGPRVVRLEDETLSYLWSSLPLPEEGWTLHLWQSLEAATAESRVAALAGAGAWFALAFAGLLWQQRWRLARERQRSRNELEQLVEARTAALRTAQDGLVQAAKLAALGQMSAALAHELNQPLTAQRMHLASLRLLLQQQRLKEAHTAVDKLDALLQRMAALTGHLKTYARKTPGGLREPLDLAGVVDQALELLAPRLRDEQIQLSLQLARPARVLGDAIRLEQVLVNLLRNGLDAMQDQAIRRLSVHLEACEGYWRLSVVDSGGGIAAEDLPQIFDPFFTTKPVGEGLGLGLAVSYAIAHELGGDLVAENQGAGACFALLLPVAMEED